MKKLIISALDFFTAKGDKELFLNKCRDNGVTSIRIIYQYAWGDNILSPYLKVGTWKAGYSEAENMPFYAQGDKIAVWDASYLSKLDYGHSLIAKYIPEVYAVLHDNTSFKMEGWEKYKYPFLSSSPDRDINDPNYSKYPGGFWGLSKYQGGAKTVQFLHLRLASLVVNSLKKYGLKILLEFNNEDLVSGWDDKFISDYYEWLKNSFADLGIPQSDIIACGRKAGIDHIGLYSQHGISKLEDVIDFDYLPHNQIILSTDGGFKGNGCQDAKGRRGLGTEDAKIIAEKAVQDNYAGIEILSRCIYLKNNDWGNLDDADFSPIEEISKVFYGGENMGEIFHGRDFVGSRKYVASVIIYDKIGKQFLVGLAEDGQLYLAVQGSKSPYVWSPEKLVEENVICMGSPSLTRCKDEDFSLICPSKNQPRIFKWHFNPLNFPDPGDSP